MAGNISLEASIRTCKIDPAYASKVQSDRFLNPGNMVCPIWNGYDSAGRPACADSFNTKNPGCNTAEDRVFVENYQRPQYVEYVNLSSGGIDGEFYGPTTPYSMTQWSKMLLRPAHHQQHRRQLRPPVRFKHLPQLPGVHERLMQEVYIRTRRSRLRLVEDFFLI